MKRILPAAPEPQQLYPGSLSSEAQGVEQRLEAVSQTIPLSSLWTVTIEKDGSIIRQWSFGLTAPSWTNALKLQGI